MSLAAWLDDNGVPLTLISVDESSQVQPPVNCEQNITKDAELAAIPRSLIFSADDVRDDPSARALLDATKAAVDTLAAHARDLVTLSIWLLHHSVTADSPLRPWVEAILGSKALDELPLFWNAEALAELDGTYVLRQRDAIADKLDQEFTKLIAVEAFAACGFTYDHWMRARGAVLRVTVQIELPGQSSPPWCLVPVLTSCEQYATPESDGFVDAEPSSSARASVVSNKTDKERQWPLCLMSRVYDVDREALVLVAAEDAEFGASVVMERAKLSNDVLANRFGLALENNSNEVSHMAIRFKRSTQRLEDKLRVLSINVPRNDRSPFLKMAIQVGYYDDVVLARHALAKANISRLRLLAASSNQDWTSAKSEFKKVLESKYRHVPLAVSVTNDMEVLRWIKAGALRELSKMRTMLAEDQDQLGKALDASGESPDKWLLVALRSRISQKRLLHWWIDLSDELISFLALRAKGLAKYTESTRFRRFVSDFISPNAVEGDDVASGGADDDLRARRRHRWALATALAKDNAEEVVKLLADDADALAHPFGIRVSPLELEMELQKPDEVASPRLTLAKKRSQIGSAARGGNSAADSDGSGGFFGVAPASTVVSLVAQFGAIQCLDALLADANFAKQLAETVNVPHAALGTPPLHLALANGHEVVVARMLESEALGVDVTVENIVSHESTVHVAARFGRLEQLQMLIARAPAVELDAVDAVMRSPLHAAAIAGQDESVRLLVGSGRVDADRVDGRGHSPLMLASSQGHREVADALLEVKGLQVNLKDMEGCTALILAAKGDHGDVVRTLADHAEVDLSAQGKGDQRSALLWTTLRNRAVETQALLEEDASRLAKAADQQAGAGDLPTSIALSCDARGNTALHLACRSDVGADLVTVLLNHAPNLLGVQNKGRQTSLDSALALGRVGALVSILEFIRELATRSITLKGGSGEETPHGVTSYWARAADAMQEALPTLLGGAFGTLVEEILAKQRSKDDASAPSLRAAARLSTAAANAATLAVTEQFLAQLRDSLSRELIAFGLRRAPVSELINSAPLALLLDPKAILEQVGDIPPSRNVTLLALDNDGKDAAGGAVPLQHLKFRAFFEADKPLAQLHNARARLLKRDREHIDVRIKVFRRELEYDTERTALDKLRDVASVPKLQEYSRVRLALADPASLGGSGEPRPLLHNGEPLLVLVTEGGDYSLRELVEGDFSLRSNAAAAGAKGGKFVERLQVFYECAKALQAVHKARWVHQDVTPDNFVSFGGRWKLVDLDRSRKWRDPVALTVDEAADLDDFKESDDQFPRSLAPEVAEKLLEKRATGTLNADFAADLFSLGMLGVYLFSTEPARFELIEYERGDVLRQLAEWELDEGNEDLVREAIPAEHGDVSATLIKLLHRNPRKRGKFRDLDHLFEASMSLTAVKTAVREDFDRLHQSNDEILAQIAALRQQLQDFRQENWQLSAEIIRATSFPSLFVVFPFSLGVDGDGADTEDDAQYVGAAADAKKKAKAAAKKKKQREKAVQRSAFSDKFTLFPVCPGGPHDRVPHVVPRIDGGPSEGYLIKVHKKWVRRTLPMVRAGFCVLGLALRIVSYGAIDLGAALPTELLSETPESVAATSMVFDSSKLMDDATKSFDRQMNESLSRIQAAEAQDTANAAKATSAPNSSQATAVAATRGAKKFNRGAWDQKKPQDRASDLRDWTKENSDVLQALLKDNEHSEAVAQHCGMRVAPGGKSQVWVCQAHFLQFAQKSGVVIDENDAELPRDVLLRGAKRSASVAGAGAASAAPPALQYATSAPPPAAATPARAKKDALEMTQVASVAETANGEDVEALKRQIADLEIQLAMQRELTAAMAKKKEKKGFLCF